MESTSSAAAAGGDGEQQPAPSPRLGPCTSLYRLALANGVSELLDVYRAAVLAVEAHLLHLPAAEPPPPLLALHHFLLEWEALLPEARGVAEQVAQRGLAGSQIMRLLSQHAHSGVPALQSCAQRLLWHCHQVLFKQLESWLVHGLLLDQAGEFFIQRSTQSTGGSDAPSNSTGGGGQASPPTLRSMTPDGGDGVGSSSGAVLDWEPLEWHAGFQV